MFKDSKCVWKLCLFFAVLIGCLLTVWIFVHRRVIRAAVKGDPLPVCPHWLPGALKKLLDAK